MNAKDNAKDNAKERIITESIHLFLKKGYAGTTTNELARLAGMSKGNVYWHFKSKDDIVQSIIEMYASQFIEEAERRIDACEGNFIDRFRMFHKFITEFARDNRELLLVFTTLLIEFASTGTDIERRMKKIQKEYILMIQKLLTDGKSEGTVAQGVDPVRYARFIGGALMGAHLQWYLGDEEAEEDGPYLARLHRQVLMKSVLREGLTPPVANDSRLKRVTGRSKKTREKEARRNVMPLKGPTTSDDQK